MNDSKHLLCIVGTRPEGIKMAPLIKALKKEPWARVTVLATAQHRGLLDQVLALFDIQPDIDLDIMRPNQTLPELTARLISALDDQFGHLLPDVVLAQGDTTTVMAAALVAFYRRIPFGHVEAGLRTHDMDNPFPEEMNRLVAGHLAKWHFVPTQRSRQNLLREGIDDRAIHVTGNTVVDALLDVASKTWPLPLQLHPERRLVLLTAHRRENFGEPFRAVCRCESTGGKTSRYRGSLSGSSESQRAGSSSRTTWWSSADHALRSIGLRSFRGGAKEGVFNSYGLWWSARGSSGVGKAGAGAPH
jgi:UDP-N-acetylglucosamine 2-epimerase (non-hydrolysing)